MKNAATDNSVNVDEVILWQYDHAPNLIALIRSLTGFAKATTTDLWTYMLTSVFTLDDANRFGLVVWSAILGVPMPDYSKVPEELHESVSADDLYAVFRKILKAKAFLYNSNCTIPAYNRYLSLIFGKVEYGSDDSSDDSEGDSLSKCRVIDYGSIVIDDESESSGDSEDDDNTFMAMDYEVVGEETWTVAEKMFCPKEGAFSDVPSVFGDIVREHPAGVGTNTPLSPAPILDMNKDDGTGQGWDNFALSPRQDNGGAFAAYESEDDSE